MKCRLVLMRYRPDDIMGSTKVYTCQPHRTKKPYRKPAALGNCQFLLKRELSEGDPWILNGRRLNGLRPSSRTHRERLNNGGGWGSTSLIRFWIVSIVRSLGCAESPSMAAMYWTLFGCPAPEAPSGDDWSSRRGT